MKIHRLTAFAVFATFFSILTRADGLPLVADGNGGMVLFHAPALETG